MPEKRARKFFLHHLRRGLLGFLLLLSPSLLVADPLGQVKYNHPGLIVDLGVGLWAWPLPMDYDSDGDLDLVVVCPDKPSNGTYFFENPGGDTKMPVFKPAVRISNLPLRFREPEIRGVLAQLRRDCGAP